MFLLYFLSLNLKFCILVITYFYYCRFYLFCITISSKLHQPHLRLGLSGDDGSVAFLRCLNRFGNIHVVMLCSKNRVNPLKSTATIPRLELQAAVLCTSLESSISKALSIQLLPTSF